MNKDTQRIEIVFPFKVNVPERAQELIYRALDIICKENCPDDSVMWPSGHGCKPTYIPLTQYEEQFRGMEFDDTIKYYEVSCRKASSQELERRKLKDGKKAIVEDHMIKHAGREHWGRIFI